MKINELFSKNYGDIKDKLGFEEFTFEKEDKFQSSFYSAYLHNSGNELYILLDATKIHESEWETLVNNWHINILSFSNNNRTISRDTMYYLKYNINLVVLYTKNQNNEGNEIIQKLEKSKNICRKIFVGVDGKFSPDDSDLDLIPFYFDTLLFGDQEELKLLKNEILEILEDEKLNGLNLSFYNDKIRSILGGEKDAL